MVKKIKWYEYLTPLVLAIFPILSLAHENIIFVKLTSIIRPILISLVMTAVFYLLFNNRLHNPLKSGILSGLLTFLLLSYGNIYLIIQDRLGTTLEHWLLVAIFALVFVGVVALIIHKVRDVQTLNAAILFGAVASF